MTSGTTIVTGATGFAARHLLDRLNAVKDVVGWYRPAGRRPDVARPMSWHAVDITDALSVRDAIQAARPSRIFHLAGAPNVAASWDSAAAHLRVNALATHHLLEAVRAFAPACRVLIVS